jgi:hypothetical protein
MDERDWLVEHFEEHRPQLRAVAYRMLGSLAEADEAVQDSWLRVSRAGADGIENFRGWLTTIVARVCLNALQARKARPEDASGVHLPDPIVRRDDALDPEHEVLMADSVGLALQIVLVLDPSLIYAAEHLAKVTLATVAKKSASSVPTHRRWCVCYSRGTASNSPVTRTGCSHTRVGGGIAGFSRTPVQGPAGYSKTSWIDEMEIETQTYNRGSGLLALKCSGAFGVGTQGAPSAELLTRTIRNWLAAHPEEPVTEIEVDYTRVDYAAGDGPVSSMVAFLRDGVATFRLIGSASNWESLKSLLEACQLPMFELVRADVIEGKLVFTPVPLTLRPGASPKETRLRSDAFCARVFDELPELEPHAPVTFCSF